MAAMPSSPSDSVNSQPSPPVTDPADSADLAPAAPADPTPASRPDGIYIEHQTRGQPVAHVWKDGNHTERLATPREVYDAKQKWLAQKNFERARQDRQDNDTRMRFELADNRTKVARKNHALAKTALAMAETDMGNFMLHGIGAGVYDEHHFQVEVLKAKVDVQDTLIALDKAIQSRTHWSKQLALIKKRKKEIRDTIQTQKAKKAKDATYCLETQLKSLSEMADHMVSEGSLTSVGVARLTTMYMAKYVVKDPAIIRNITEQLAASAARSGD